MAMKHTLWFTSLLTLSLCIACESTTRTSNPSLSTPPIPRNGVTGTGANGQPITVTIVPVQQDNLSTHKLLVRRGDATFWLRSSNMPNRFGCDLEVGSYDTFGCYFGSAKLADLDRDGEPEILSAWEHDGTGGYKSFHLYRWDGSGYPLVGEFFEMQLQVEILTRGEQQDIVLRYNVGPHQLPTPWVDVYALAGEQLREINDQYPALYQQLLEQYRQMLPEYQMAARNGWPEALSELETRIAAAERILANNAPR